MMLHQLSINVEKNMCLLPRYHGKIPRGSLLSPRKTTKPIGSPLSSLYLILFIYRTILPVIQSFGKSELLFSNSFNADWLDLAMVSRECSWQFSLLNEVFHLWSKRVVDRDTVSHCVGSILNDLWTTEHIFNIVETCIQKTKFIDGVTDVTMCGEAITLIWIVLFWTDCWIWYFSYGLATKECSLTSILVETEWILLSCLPAIFLGRSSFSHFV